MADYLHNLKEFLISFGTDGVKQSKITYHFRSLATASELLEQLEGLRKLRAVDKYEIPAGMRGGRPVTYWRATNRIWNT